jgi:hypothetical protein
VPDDGTTHDDPALVMRCAHVLDAVATHVERESEQAALHGPRLRDHDHAAKALVRVALGADRIEVRRVHVQLLDRERKRASALRSSAGPLRTKR